MPTDPDDLSRPAKGETKQINPFMGAHAELVRTLDVNLSGRDLNTIHNEAVEIAAAGVCAARILRSLPEVLRSALAELRLGTNHARARGVRKIEDAISLCESVDDPAAVMRLPLPDTPPAPPSDRN